MMNNKGFTLIELIATIAILALISVISFVSINGILEESKVKDCENLIISIKSAAKEYVSDHRYDNSFYEENYDDATKIKTMSVYRLESSKYLSSDVVNPFDKSEIDGSNIIIKIYLNDDYTVKTLDIYKITSSEEDNKYICDNVEEDDKYSCNEEWWSFS